MPTLVTDPRSNANEQIVHAAEVIGRGAQKAAIFGAVSIGSARVKTVSAIVAATSIPRQQVLNAAKQLVDNQIIHQAKKAGELAYEKDAFYARHKKRILKLAADPGERQRVPTKRNPVGAATTVVIRVPRRQAKAHYITADDVDSLSRIGRTKSAPEPAPLSERKFKQGIQRVLGEKGRFEDWGGEGNDLWTTRVRLGNKRRRAAFAFKGRGTKGKLVPGKLGKNGDQIQRLFRSAADIFFVQYWGQIDESVVEQMQLLATAKSYAEGRDIWFGVIDGADSQRLIEAYPRHFPQGTRSG
ncbi:MAG: hypothetical protein L0206_20560 [Actinobacteria bacterium]|nr:hypothetical protein [Actinomycetota bacterium]